MVEQTSCYQQRCAENTVGVLVRYLGGDDVVEVFCLTCFFLCGRLLGWSTVFLHDF